ncbi:CHAT domain-containing protein [Mesorhizobium sp. M0138]|uniref:CHAT domain-containing protein n=1 Tax=Mesorhizobium sp. M0138 TaxID=2956891 RepID=UPI003334C932
MDLIVRFTRESSLPYARGSSISPEQVFGSEEAYFVAWAASEEEMSALPASEGMLVSLPPWSSDPSSGLASDWLWGLVPPEAQQKVAMANEPVQLMIQSGNVGVDLLPWESLLRLNLNPVGFSVARLVPSSLRPPPLTVVPPLRMLLVSSNAHDDIAFNERDRSILRESADSQFYDVREARRATGTSVMGVVQEFDPHIIHFMGHGGIVGGEGAVVLRDETTGLTNWIRASQVSRGLPVSTRLLCISTGFSQRNYDISGLVGFAHAPQSVRLPTSIVNRSDVDESGVAAFWGEFYSELIAERGNVLRAYNTAVARLARAGTLTPTESFSLVIREDGYRPLRLGSTIDPMQHAAEVQAQLAARLATDLQEKLKTFGDTEMGKALGESYDEERSRFSDLSSTAESFKSE